MATPWTDPLLTMGVAIDGAGVIWRYEGVDQMVKIGQMGITGTLGPAQAVTANEVVPPGHWVFVGTGGTPVEILIGNGTTETPAAGNIYQLK